MSDSQRLRYQFLASLIGAAVPAMVFGKAGLAVVALAALLLAVPDLIRRQIWRNLWRRLKTPIGLTVLATAILWLPGVVFSIAPGLSFEAWARTWAFVAVAALFWDLLVRRDDLQVLALHALLVATLVTLVLAAFGFAVPEFLALIHAKGWTAEDPDRALKQFASAAMLVIPVVLWAALRLGGKWRVVAFCNGVGLSCLLIVTESRSSMAGLLAMLIVTGSMLVLRGRSRRALVGACAAIAITVAAVLGWMYTIPYSEAWTPDLIRRFNVRLPVWLIDLPRQEIWAFTWNKFAESPWVGHGINAVNYLPGASQPIPGLGGRLTFIPGHPHSWALELLAETGFVGFVPLVAVVGSLLVALLKRFHRTRDPAFLAASCVHLGYWVSGLFNFSFWSAWWQVSYVLLLALAYPGRPSPIGSTREGGMRFAEGAPPEANNQMERS